MGKDLFMLATFAVRYKYIDCLWVGMVCWQQNCNIMTVNKVRIKENSWVAKLAARKLRYSQVAIVLGNTVHLHNTTKAHFMANRRWVIHELKHVEQFQEHGFVGFLWKYVVEYARNGYFQNKYEVEARLAERDEGLLNRYDIS